MSGEANPLDAALDAGFGGGEDAEAGIDGAPDTGDAQIAPDAQAAVPEQDASAPDAGVQETKPRDASGKFAPTTATTTPAKPKDAGKAATQQGPQKTGDAAQAAPELKPPQNWKAAAREEWANLPRHVKEEAKRVEIETMRVMRESAQARKFAENFEKTLTPYKAFITGEPLQVMNSLFQTAVALQTAPPVDKAHLVAQIIKGYNVDIETLDKLLAGQAPQDTQTQARQSQQPAQFRDPRVDQWLEREQQEKTRAAQQTVQTFAREAEFLDEPWPGKVRSDGSPVLVRDLVANLLDAASSDGIDLSLKEAYAQVVQQHPDVSKVLRQREEAQRAATAKAATQRARAASSSVRSQPASRPQGAQKADLDAILDEAFSSATGR